MRNRVDHPLCQCGYGTTTTHSRIDIAGDSFKECAFICDPNGPNAILILELCSKRAKLAAHDFSQKAPVSNEVKRYDVVTDSVQKLRPTHFPYEMIPHSASKSVPRLFVAGCRVDLGCADIGGEYDDCFGKAYCLPASIRKSTVLQNLKELVEDPHMSLFDLIEEKDTERTFADGIRKLAALLIADVSRRCAD